jgi:hypothetical protein
VYLHDNDDGYTGDADPVTLEFCDIAHNGHTKNPPQRNMYVWGGPPYFHLSQRVIDKHAR